MKKGLIFISCLLLFKAFVSCEKNVTKKIEISTVEIPQNCAANAIKFDEVHVINSKEEFENYFTCNNNPQIDFSTKTLLVVRGVAPNGIEDISTELFANKNLYSLKIDITLDDTTIAQGWCVVVVTDKINIKSITLIIN